VGDKKAADEVASKLRAKLQLGEFGFDDPKLAPTFKEYAKKWIKTTVPATCELSTVREYQDILKNHVYANFGDKNDITAITRGDVKEFLLEKFNEGYATSTVVHFRNCLSGIFKLRISKGDNIADVSNQLGHHSVKFTMDVYYHWFIGKKKFEVDALDDPSFTNSSAPSLHPEAEKGLTANG
jgi:hypothetical protein